MTNVNEFDRTAVVTVQGGGVYGLSLLGQLDAVMTDHRITPLALAGTSAGAIVATLLWSGYKPKEIRDLFIGLTTQEGGLTSLLGPFTPPEKPFDFAELRRTLNDIEELRGRAKPLLKVAEDWTNTNKFKRWYRLWRAWRQAKRGLPDHVDLKRTADHLQEQASNRGIFTGERLESQIDSWIRTSRKLQPYANDLPDNRLLTFRDIEDLRGLSPAASFAPLFLTATNLDHRRLELFSSIDPRYGDAPIARAVRASACFPGFFRPVPVTLSQEVNWFVDGGVISNYPSWVFSDELRRRLYSQPRYRPLATRPWVHIGLRLAPDETAGAGGVESGNGFLRAFADLALGRARDELEFILSSFVTRSWTVRQPINEAGGPNSFLEVDKLDEPMIQSMYNRGREFAEHALANLSFALPDATSVKQILTELIDEVLAVFGKPDNATLKFRGNIFIPHEQGLRLRYSVNMDDDPDRKNGFRRFRHGFDGILLLDSPPMHMQFV